MITMLDIKRREARTLLVGWLIQCRAVHKFLNQNRFRVAHAEQDAWEAEVWENAKCGIIYQLFRQEDYAYIRERIAILSAYRSGRG